jgi:type II restriction/modification system DNA methylase subunit YeeA
MPTNHSALKKFAQSARRQLREQVSARLEQVLKTDSAELREKAAAVQELKSQVAATSKAEVVDRAAYTWFNRFCALRFMDANRYNRIAAVSPAEGFTQPEILQEAKQGYIDADLKGCVDFKRVFDLLGGRLPSADPQQEAYRLLLVGVCNSLYAVMPFLFEPIADYTELLMPPDLLSEHSVLHALREAMTAEACQDVEVIGWLYQFYISERKDEVFEGLKKGQKIEAQDIPAATQLFTPHWIVRYLVENSLGRLWMLNRPGSKLAEQMEYYIRPERVENREQSTGDGSMREEDFLRVSGPEEIKVCDPACGSGHMLTYAFDLLYAVYEEEGYPAGDIPRLVLEKNLYGIEIDERAGALAAFALAMKARGKDRRFFSRKVMPNICVLENINFTEQELKEYSSALGEDLFTEPLIQTLRQFTQVKTYGSLIKPYMHDVIFALNEIERKNIGSTLFLNEIDNRVKRTLIQAEYLSSNYDIVVANPPYMGNKNTSEEIKAFSEYFYPKSKFDLFSMFIERIIDLTTNGGFIGLMTPFTWMFLTSYEDIRKEIIENLTITTLIQPEYHSFFDSAYVPICGFTLNKNYLKNYIGSYIDLSSFYGADEQPQKALEAIKNPKCGWFYQARALTFKNIPGSPIAYTMSEDLINVFSKSSPLSAVAEPRKGLSTGKNDEFLRFWYEVKKQAISLFGGSKWYPMTKGGNYRKWFGNNEYVVLWENDGKALKKFPGSVIRNEKYYFRDGATWNAISSSNFSMRYIPNGFINNAAGPIVYGSNIFPILALLNSSVASSIMKLIFPTMNYEVGSIATFPVIEPQNDINKYVKELIELAEQDWNSYETSWDFTVLPLIHNSQTTLKNTFEILVKRWDEITLRMKYLEEGCNKEIIKTYGLGHEISPTVSLENITLTCNPYSRYTSKKTRKELEILVIADSLREFISYAVGCMFGRYSLDKPGLVLANQGETLADYLRQVPDPSFTPDEDNAIPVLDGDWFSDDITERFKKFLRVTFGDAHYEENLAFIEQAIGRDIRSYFLKEFYTQHLKMYQKRPIYWLFSSPRGSFNVLIYLHRYTRDTVPVILNRYLREFRAKLEARKAIQEHVSISPSASQREKTAALKEIENLKKTLEELRVYERDVLYPLAADQIEIDLDDGVKVNYAKFGKALAKIPGLSE